MGEQGREPKGMPEMQDKTRLLYNKNGDLKMNKETIRKLGMLDDRIREVGKGYYNTTSLASVKDTRYLGDEEKVELVFDYDLKDMLLLAATRETPVLMTGRSDSGKTDLATIVMTALFGGEETKLVDGKEVVVKEAGFYKLDVDNDLDEENFMDPDLSKLVKAKLSEVLQAPKWVLTSKGLILDEGNRTDPKIAAKIMRMLDPEKVIKLKAGIAVKLGVPYEAKDGSIKRYFWPVMCINEGANYTGTFDMDYAAKRRATMEIPMDEAIPQATDVMSIIEGRNGNLCLKNGEEHFQDVLDVMDGLEDIKLDKKSKMYLSYLSNMEKCVKRKKGIKGDDFNPSQCDKDGCHVKKQSKGMCGATRGFTEGLVINLKKVARGFAGMRGLKAIKKAQEYLDNQENSELEKTLQVFSDTKYTGQQLAKAFVQNYIENLRVTPQDIQAAVPFVGYSKLQVAEGWIKKHPDFDGSKWEALKYIAQTSLENIDKFILKFKDEIGVMRAQAQGKDVKLTEEQEDRLKKHYEQYDPWIKDTLLAFFSEPEQEHKTYKQTVKYLLDGGFKNEQAG